MTFYHMMYHQPSGRIHYIMGSNYKHPHWWPEAHLQLPSSSHHSSDYISPFRSHKAPYGDHELYPSSILRTIIVSLQFFCLSIPSSLTSNLAITISNPYFLHTINSSSDVSTITRTWSGSFVSSPTNPALFFNISHGNGSDDTVVSDTVRTQLENAVGSPDQPHSASAPLGTSGCSDNKVDENNGAAMNTQNKAPCQQHFSQDLHIEISSGQPKEQTDKNGDTDVDVNVKLELTETDGK
jgi:hypothetical protein